MNSSTDQLEKGFVEELSEETANQKLKLGVFDLWALGITVVIGGQYFSWNAGLAAGFGSYLISTLLVGSSYVCLCFCNAEITSALPFAGGAYGIARVSLGLYPGFMIGCLEAIEYILYVSSSVIVLTTLICDITQTSLNLIPVYSLVFFLVAVTIQIQGGLVFWRCNAFLGLVSIAILLMYNLGSLPWVNIANVSSPTTTGGENYTYFIGGFSGFLAVTPLAAWWYVGVESLNLSCAFVANVRVCICICTAFDVIHFLTSCNLILPSPTIFSLSLSLTLSLSLPLHFIDLSSFHYFDIAAESNHWQSIDPLFAHPCSDKYLHYFRLLIHTALQ